DSGATFRTQDGVVGDGGSEECSFTVSGNGTTWTNLNDLIIGNQAPGKLVVGDDAHLTALSDITVGQDAASTVRIENGGLVQGKNCTLNKGRLEVRGLSTIGSAGLSLDKAFVVGGESGTGTVLVENGGVISALEEVDLKGSSTITISGTGV